MRPIGWIGRVHGDEIFGEREGDLSVREKERTWMSLVKFPIPARDADGPLSSIPGTESPGSCSFSIYFRPAKNAKFVAVTCAIPTKPERATFSCDPRFVICRAASNSECEVRAEAAIRHCDLPSNCSTVTAE